MKEDKSYSKLKDKETMNMFLLTGSTHNLGKMNTYSLQISKPLAWGWQPEASYRPQLVLCLEFDATLVSKEKVMFALKFITYEQESELERNF